MDQSSSFVLFHVPYSWGRMRHFFLYVSIESMWSDVDAADPTWQTMSDV